MSLTLDQKLDLIEHSGVVGWKLAFDGCHKIYILTRRDEEAEASVQNYEIRPPSEIREIWSRSCGLRFVHLWNLEIDVPWNIAQGEDEDQPPKEN